MQNLDLNTKYAVNLQTLLVGDPVYSLTNFCLQIKDKEEPELVLITSLSTGMQHINILSF